LEKSKESSEEKDTITFLDIPARWTDFEKEVKIRDRIIESLEKGVSRALLYALSESIFTEYELKKKGKVPIWKVWKFFYVIRRFMKSSDHGLGINLTGMALLPYDGRNF